MNAPLLPLLTRDPVTGHEMIVTRLESPATGLVVQGRFSLGWVGRLTPEQLDFVGLLLRHRTNVQQLANELGVAYNTVRSRLDDVVAAVGGPPVPPPSREDRLRTLERLRDGDIDVDAALAELRGAKP